MIKRSAKKGIEFHSIDAERKLFLVKGFLFWKKFGQPGALRRRAAAYLLR